MALVKSQTDLARPPRDGQGGQSRTCTRARRIDALVERTEARRPQQQRPHHDAAPGRRPQAALPRSSISAATRTASPAKVERLEYDPNRSANIALLCYADGERRYIIAPQGVAVGHAARCAARKRRSSRATPAAAQHSGRHHDALRRDAARQGRADRARGGRRRCSCSRAKASTRSCACAPARSAGCTSTAARPSARSATRSTTCARSARRAPTAGAASARRCAACHEPGRPPARRPHARRPPSGVAVGQAAKGYKTRRNKRTADDDRAPPPREEGIRRQHGTFNQERPVRRRPPA